MCESCKFTHSVKVKHSLAAHFDAVSYASSDVELAAFFHPDRSEVGTIAECAAVRFSKRAGELYFPNPAPVETPFRDALQAGWNREAPETAAPLERPGLEPP